MVNLRLRPSTLNGTVAAPASKSDAHRNLVIAALSNKPTRIEGLESSGDIDATLGCLRVLGATMQDGVLRPVHPARSALLNCEESGTTLRLMLPVVAALGVEARFIGKPQLRERPLAPLVKALAEGGAEFDRDAVPLTVSGRLRKGSFEIPGDVSSQFVSGLLIALPLMDAGGMIHLTTPLQSAGYVAMTLDAMERFSVMAIEREQGYLVPGNQRYRSPGVVRIEGDWSNAAFFLAAGAMGMGVTVRGLPETSHQPDRAIAGLLRRFGAQVNLAQNAVHVAKGTLRGITVDVSQTPDLAPVLAVLGAAAEGTTRLENAARLRLKESNRLASTYAMLQALGAQVHMEPDALEITGTGRLAGGTVDGAGDHRIVMAAAIAALLCDAPVTILGAEAVEKSYPTFFMEYEALGGKRDVIFDR